MDPDMALAFQALTAAIVNLPAQIVAANQVAKENADRETYHGEGVTPALDRPSPVIVMGPKPLPVKVVESDADKKDKDPKDPKDPKDKPQEMGGIARMIGAVVAKFAAVIGPMAILGAVVGNAASGFGTMVKAVNLFAATLTPIIMPVAIVLATAFTAIADVVSAALPGMQGFISIMIAMGVPALVMLIEAVLGLADAIKWVINQIPSTKDMAGQVTSFARGMEDLPLFGDAIKFTNDLAFGVDGTGSAFSGNTFGTKKTEDATAIVMNALRDVTKSFTMSVGPKAQISGLESVRQSVQMAALNQDPLEAKMLRVQQQIAEMLNKAVTAMGGEPVYVSTGGDAGGDF